VAEAELDAHLRARLGVWPPPPGLTVVGSPARDRPGWDGAPERLVGVGTPTGAVVSVPPGRVEAVRAAGLPTTDGWLSRIAAAMGEADTAVIRGVFRAAGDLPDLAPLGDWVDVDDPVVPAWLRPFGGEALVARDRDGAYAAGVGLKRHDPSGYEIAVGTEPQHRGRGMARRLVVTAARRVRAEGRAVTYLHDPANAGSARVADAAGFPDRGWWVLGLQPE
jgi:GNAT superfamily N-acetyltransferase